jgi:riboflavin synthase alpha subunit
MVGGSAATHGFLRITERGRVTGKLGGHKVSGHFAGAATVASAMSSAPAWEQSLRRFAPFGTELGPTG